MFKKDMVQKAIDVGRSKPAHGVTYIKENFGVDMKTTQFTQAKMALLGKRGGKKKKEEKLRKQREAYAAKKARRIGTVEDPVAIRINSNGVEINYCPHCGCNLNSIKNALQIAAMAEGVNRG